MNKVINKREQGTALTSVALRLTPIAAGCAILLSTATGSVFAQEAAAAKEAVVAKDAVPVVDTVVVTGIRRGIEAAISIKKNSSSIVEAISAEDIGKLPDSSVAASIARLPGVTAQRSRSSGKAADVSVRGLAPSFNGS
ncbi:MAG: TonB-dependent receptor plug domain-containing protein, partial [Undibacterium sp.]|nr:TonB-dependent receptor plug domain-containing protein [Undibacterium sp.]